MRRVVAFFLILFVGFVAAKAVADSIPDGPGGPNIVLENQSSLKTSTLASDLPFFQEAVDQVCAAWHCTGHLYLASAPNTPSDWVVVINDYSSVNGAIGFHSEHLGFTYAEVSIKTAVEAQVPWGTVLTHELDEMLVDPEASATENTDCQTDVGTGNLINCTFYMKEIADPVQGYWYRLGPVRVSDWVYRNWFVPDSPGPYDAGRHLSKPLSLGKNSYLSVYGNGHWQQQATFPLLHNWDSFYPEHSF